MYKTNFMMMDNNSVKRFKQTKDCEKSLEKNEQEVLVLPPNLLQKLGIHLGNIQNTSDYCIAKDNVEPSHLQRGRISKNNSAHLEHLAKEIPGNVCEKSVPLSSPILSSIIIPQQKPEQVIANNAACTPLRNVSLNTSFADSVTSEHLVSSGLALESNKMLQTKDLTCPIHTEKNNLNTNNVNKYSDIDDADELVQDTDKELDKSVIKSINSGADRAREEIYCTVKVHNITEESNSRTFAKDKTMTKNAKTPIPCTSLISQISANNTLTDIQEIKIMEVDEDVKLSKEKNNNISRNVDDCNIPPRDKQYLDVMRRESVIKKLVHVNQCVMEKVDLSPQHLTIKSKLCIQGVEKPGGTDSDKIDEQTEKITLRTYQNRKTKNGFKNKMNDEILVNELIAKTCDSTDVHTYVNNSVTCVTEQNCTCNDFGKLQFYDNVSKYQHLHFLAKNTVHSTPSMLFEIFNEGDGPEAGLYPETDDNFSHNDVQLDDLSNICCTDFLTSESDIPEQTIEDQKPLASETCVNKYNKSMITTVECSDITSTDIHSPGVIKVIKTVSDANLSKQINQDKKCEHAVPETLRNNDEKLITAEGSEKSKKRVTKKRKRTSSGKDGGNIAQCTEKNYNSPAAKKFITSVKCAVCSKEIPEVDWDSHLYEKHCYIGWKEGSTIINLDDKKLRQNLYETLKKCHRLHCTFCGRKEKDLKKFLAHLKICIKKIFTNINVTDINFSEDVNIEINDSVKCEICNENVLLIDWTEHMTVRHIDTKTHIEIVSAPIENVMKIDVVDEEIKLDLVKCAVCKMEVNSSDWIDHIRREHNYLAWKDGDPELNLYNVKEIHDYLQNILNDIGGLVCSKCGLVRHYPKSFMKHIKMCNGNVVSDSQDDSTVGNQSNDDKNQTQGDDNSLTLSSSVECGVCYQKVAGTDWLDHIHKEHNYLAKIRGVPPLDLESDVIVRKHLHGIRLITGHLTCGKCGIKRKIIKNFMEHIKECDGTTNKITESTKDVESDLNNTKDVSICDKTTLQYNGTVTCGVCKDEVNGEQWLEHIQKEHNYIAWIEGAQPLNLVSEEETWQYLNNITKKIGVLICGKCGLNRKYGKAYMQHVKECDGSKATLVDQLNDTQIIENNINSTYLEDCTNCSDKVKCGVCGVKVEGERWLEHIQVEHEYMAWVEGRTPLNQEDKEFINTYLKLLIRRIGALVCAKCGLERKLAKSYLQHVSKCGGSKDDTVLGSQEAMIEEENEFIHKEPVECGVCSQQVEGGHWIGHIRLKHDYLARISGKPPLDVNDQDQVRRHLSSMRKYVHQLICNNCGEGRKNVRAYLKHVQYCDGFEKSDNGSEDIENVEEFIPTGKVQCGVCKEEVDGEEWINHIHKEHDYMATIEGRPSLNLDNEEEIRTHLNTIRRYVREFVCNKCGESRKFVKSYMKHLKNCDVTERLSEDMVVDSRRVYLASVATEEEKGYQLEFPGTVVCGVCDREVYGNQWVHHIRTEHNYIAHVKGKTALDMSNRKQIKTHLNAVSKHAGGLYCNKCGLMRLYVKSYLVHVQQCGNSDNLFTTDMNDSEAKNESDESFNPNNTTKVSDESFNNGASHFVYEGIVKCAVCHIKVEGKEWIEHIQKQHNYLAWVDGQPPLDLEDQDQVNAHLYELSRLQNGLTCNICDAKRKYVKSFLDHIRNCNNTLGEVGQGTEVECAVCSEKMPVEEWKNHAMKNHYNIAWTVGSDPIDLKNPYAVERYLKEYKKSQKSLICKICKLTRVSCAGFYAHIITCGKTDEEIEDYKLVCEICNSKYLCIYKNQHFAFHREQEYAKEKKSRALELAQTNADEGGTPGRRRAAEKAKIVIEDYKSIMNKFKHKCQSCNFGTDVVEELEVHTCEAASDRLSDSDGSASVHLDAHSDDTDSDVDSNISMEEEQQAASTDKKKRQTDAPKVSHHIPFKINSASHYVSQAALDFCNMHYTTDELFPDLKPRQCQEVDVECLPKYMPTVEESCKVKIGNGEWDTYKRFQAKNDTVFSIFVGGSIRCVSWASARGGAEQAEDSYLAVAGHGAPDAPRLPASQLVQHSALIQLWDFADFDSVPKFVLGLALDYGTVWAMDWCPSGTRDLPPCDEDHTAEARLGLLALACSNGSAYILSVPYPAQDTDKPQIIKIKPSVELRLCSNEDRRKYQATAISWSKQKGHIIILVGYADGSTAFYDLSCDSPLLKTVEDDVTILYPFQDDRPHNTCISDVGLFASGVTEGGRGAWGAWGGASCTGVHAALRAAAPRLHAPLAASAARFTPHWPSLLVTADEAIANYMTNELEWHGGGRRLGGQRALATCDRCGAAAALTPPALRLMRTHPAYRDPRRDVVGILRMAPLAKKRSKHTNDELSMKVEPLAYDDAIKEYGIEFKLKSHMNKADQQVVVSEAKAQFPERFPLAEVPVLAFCPTPAAHRYLAVPTHSGLLFIVTM